MDSEETETEDKYIALADDSEETKTDEEYIALADDSPGSEKSRVSGIDHNEDVSSKMGSELGLDDDFKLLHVDVDGIGENGVAAAAGKDLASGRKSEKEYFAGHGSLIEACLARCKDPESVLQDIRDRLPIHEFCQERKEKKRKKQRALKMKKIGRRSAKLFAKKLQDEGQRAFKKIKDKVDQLKTEGQPLVKWVPAEEQRHCRVPTLEDLSMASLIRNAKFISSVDCVPYVMREKVTNLLCDYRKIDINFMRILVAGSPEEISVKDCSSMTTEQFNQIFGNCDVKNLKVLHLELCGQFMFDFTLRDIFSRSSANFYALTILSLKGAAGLTDERLRSLTFSAPSLKSINLSQCSVVTAHGIHILANYYSFTLRELYVDECPMIDATLMLPALMELKRLEVLSVAGIMTVTDEFVGKVAEVCGLKLKELRLADCRSLTDKSTEVLGAKCPNIISLDLSNLDNLTNLSLKYIAYGCQSILHLKLHRNRFSDDALGAFLEISGQSLTELSLNSIRKVGLGTALSIARCAKNLETLDLSWCRNLSDEMVGLIVRSCRSLKLLKLFGCPQITEKFFKGHSNRIVRIVGPENMPIRDNDGLTKLIEGQSQDPLRCTCSHCKNSRVS